MGDAFNKQQLAELYGIYYNAFAGALREIPSILYERRMDVDGYPKYIITIDETQYACRDAALRDILKEDFEKYAGNPYEDTSRSYVQHYGGNTIIYEGGEGTGEAGGTRRTGSRIDYEKEARNTQRRIDSERRKEIDVIKQKNRELKKDARGFRYDPNYDHYYSDRLPDILKELDSNGAVIAARIACIALSCAGVVMALAVL